MAGGKRRHSCRYHWYTLVVVVRYVVVVNVTDDDAPLAARIDVAVARSLIQLWQNCSRCRINGSTEIFDAGSGDAGGIGSAISGCFAGLEVNSDLVNR